MKIAIGSDGFGSELKNLVIHHLQELGHECVDLTNSTNEPVDYPDIAEKVALDVASGSFERGILICGTGIGMAIAANKIPGIRAAQIYDIYSAERAMKSNNAKIVCLGSMTIGKESALMLVDAWLKSEFLGGRSAPKVEKLERLDSVYRRREV